MGVSPLCRALQSENKAYRNDDSGDDGASNTKTQRTEEVQPGPLVYGTFSSSVNISTSMPKNNSNNEDDENQTVCSTIFVLAPLYGVAWWPSG